MTAEQLREVRAAYKERLQLLERIAELESMRISPRTAAYGGERVQKTLKGDIQLDNIARMNELLEQYNAALARCTALTGQFEEALEKLNSRARRLMRMYYIDGYTWERVAVEMDMSWRRVMELKRRAVDIIAGERG